MTHAISFLLGITFAVCAFNAYKAAKQAKLERDLRDLLAEEPRIRPGDQS